jgi:hypothetical protein
MRKEESRSILADIDALMKPVGKTLSRYECLGFGRFSRLAAM